MDGANAVSFIAQGNAEKRYYYAKSIILNQKCWNTFDYFIAKNILLKSGQVTPIKNMEKEVKENNKQQYDPEFLDILENLYANNRFIHYLIPEMEFLVTKFNNVVPPKIKQDFYLFLRKLSEDFFFPELIEEKEIKESVNYNTFGSIFVLLDKPLPNYLKVVYSLKTQKVKRMLIEARNPDNITKANKIIDSLKNEIKNERKIQDKTIYKGNKNVDSFWFTFDF